ncbi:uncharacterized protein LOC133846043 [Drosophila sulfurigaster albostrigata]|uniref:uncharacterized protein LOC133846043 n=1 Tax=Drosophila sulfurigaster albostrigata TaxID=89887 RepID=UPI002D219D1B|nr:uncharacterized protein LOC133846043 [Drosophila sulfurigaster albostrigata]
MDINSLSYFKIHWIVWKTLGLDAQYVNWKPMVIINIVTLHLAFNIGYPFHLAMSMFRNGNLTDDIKNLTTFAVCFAGTLKSAIYVLKFYKIRQMEQIIELLDLRINGEEETDIYIKLRRQLRNILYGFAGIYLIVGIFAELSFLFQTERGLMYPAWIPFDWQNSTLNYYVANAYQVTGISYHLIQNFANDCYPAMMLCLISGHIKMLYRRFENMGFNDPSDAEAQSDLENCITDHKRLLKLFQTLESFMSLSILIQFAVTGINLCISNAAVWFFVTEPMGRTYFLFYAMGVPIQIFPTCYYGTETEQSFEELPYAAFSSNWINQSRSFKQKLRIFVECSLKKNTALAGGMLRIHVDTFFSTIKFAYSLLTILLQMQKQIELTVEQKLQDNDMAIDSLIFFRSHWTVWRILGPAYRQVTWIKLYIVYNTIMHLLITIGNPLHLGITLFRNGNLTDDIRNLTFFATCLACSLKFIIYTYNFDKVTRMEKLLMQLDSHVKYPAEMKIYHRLKIQLNVILYVFIGICIFSAASAELGFLMQEGRGLLNPAWFPFDWRNSNRNFYIANFYQMLGSVYQLMQNYVNDCYPVVMLCLISAHIKMLYIRVEQLGLNDSEDVAVQIELENCITDHKHLLELFHTLESFMSLPMLIQIVVSAVNVCVSIAGVLFFITAPMTRAYFVIYAMAMPLEIFPTCYYGTDNEIWFGKLPYAAFSCNWMDQSRSFKRNLMLFVERSLKRSTAMAGGMLRIHVDTFFSTLKFAYSLFTILLQMRNS